MVAKGSEENKSMESVAANGVSTVNPPRKAKDEKITLAAHFSHDGKDYLPGDEITVSPSLAQSLRNAGYAKRED